jgi:beta-glucosidase
LIEVENDCKKGRITCTKARFKRLIKKPETDIYNMDNKPEKKFPENFTWGAAAASYQIEGAAYADGKGLSVWDMMCRQPGKVFEGHTGEVACDHYNRYREDVALMKQIDLQAYRLSVSWPRVLPDGTGAINEKGLDFYDRLVDELLQAGIQPWVTLFHWDYPYALFCRGGWLNPDSPEWFAKYADILTKRLSDRVSNWMTLNEPQVFLDFGHRTGAHAPGIKYGMEEVLLASHHTLLAHGRAVQAIRENAVLKPSIGWAPVGAGAVPASNSAEDIEAARKATLDIHEKTLWNNTWFSDPVFLGHYPEDGLKLFGSAVPKYTDAEMEIIHQPIDFYGVNIYTAGTVRAGENGKAEGVESPQGCPRTLFYWTVKPEALYWIPKFLYERYKTPMVITENGLSNQDWVALDGKVHDAQRIDFLTRYLRELHRAIEDGVDMRGYLQWSIMDNFEWADGYRQRFGLVHVDYQTQKRTLKDSALWFKKVIDSNGSVLLNA